MKFDFCEIYKITLLILNSTKFYRHYFIAVYLFIYLSSALRGAKKDSESDYKSIMSFPSMQQQPMKDRMALYREELQRQV